MPIVGHENGEQNRNKAANYSRWRQESVRDCLTFADKRGLSTEIANPERRAACASDLHAWLVAYHPPTAEQREQGLTIGEPFFRPFSPSHRELIDTIERLVLHGGATVVAMPRESGKTTIMVRALIWAALNGHRRFPVLGTSDDRQFQRLMRRGIKTILETSTPLAEDYPEVMIPILALERMINRAHYQTWDNEPTRIAWSNTEIVLPDNPLSRERGNAQAVVSGGGLTGALRGMVYALPSGEQLRPDLLLIDDPQTRASAKSPMQVAERELIIKGDLMGMRGHRPLATMLSCTPIYPDDLAIRLLDQKRSPQFHAIRVKMLKSMPESMPLWEEYDVIRRQVLAGECEAEAANEFYQQRQAEMDRGAEHYWPEKCDPHKVSAIQCAMDEYLDDPAVFLAEKQCEPEPLIQSEMEELKASALCRRISTTDKGIVPTEHVVLSSHIDVQGNLLYYAVCSWSQNFGGQLLEFQTWPRRRSDGQYFLLRQIRAGLKKKYPGLDQGGVIRAGVRDCVQYLASKRYPREDGTDFPISLILVDGRWMTDDVEAGVIESRIPNAMLALGASIRAIHAPMALWKKEKGEIRGDHWIQRKPARRKRMLVHVDVNHWKTQLHAALSIPDMHQEALRWYNAPATHHQLISDHCVSEYAARVKDERSGRTIDEWLLRQSTLDNHGWDNLVGCMAAASMRGIRKAHARNDEPRKRPVRRVRKAKAW